MKKEFALPALAAAGGAAGFFLRRWQLSSAYLPEAGLFIHGAPATYALLGLTAVLALAFLVLSRKKREGLDDFLPAFGCPAAGQMTILAAAGIMLFAAGIFGMQDGFRALRLWRSSPGMYQLSNPVSQLLAGALCVPAGLGMLHMGRMAYRWELNNGFCVLAPFPALTGLVWVFSTHLKHGTEPVLMRYGFSLFATLLLTLAHYYAAGFLYGRPRPRRAVFFALTGATVGIISLADRPDLFTAAATAAFSLSSLGLARALLGGPWPERMPPAGEDGGDFTTDSSDSNI
mgnify:CR=1 FL=1